MSSIRIILNSILSEMEKKRQKGKRDKLEKARELISSITNSSFVKLVRLDRGLFRDPQSSRVIIELLDLARAREIKTRQYSYSWFFGSLAIPT